MRAIDFEEGFLGELAVMGQVGYLGKVMGADTKAGCNKAGGTWDAKAKLCAMPGAAAPKPIPAPTKKETRQAAREEKQATKQAAREEKQADREAAQLARRKAECLRQGNIWEALRGVCTPKSKPVSAQQECTNQGGTWFPGVKKCVLADVVNACTAKGGTMVRGQCKVPEAKPVKPAKPVPPKQACVNAGGQWFAAQKLCMTAEQLAACTTQGGTPFKGQCRLPVPVPIAPPVVQPGAGTGAPGLTTRKACRAAGGTWKRNQCQIGAPYVAPMPTPTVQPCPSGYQLSPDGQSCYPTTGAQQPPLTTEQWFTQPPITQPESQPGAAPTLPGFPGYGGEGPGASGPSGAPGAPYFDSAGMQPDQLVEGGVPGAGAGNECSEGFNATLPQEYEDEFGKMVVLQVFCKQAAQQASPFTSFADQSQAEVISGSFGPMGTRPISAVEAEEMGSAAPAGEGGFSGLGW